MGSVVDFLSDVWDTLVTVVTVTLMIALFPTAIILSMICDSCAEFMSDQLGEFFSWLGIDPEDIIEVQVQDQKIIQDDTFYKNLMTQVALEHQATQMGIIDLLAVKSQGVRGSLQKYSRYGESEYIDGLPETTVNTISVNKDAVDTAVQEDVGYDVTITKIGTKVPKEDEWVLYRMTQLYGMNQSSLVFNYSSDVWVMDGFYYDYGAGVYKVNAYLQSTPSTTTVINIGNYVPNIGYVVTYVKDGTTDSYYWVYFIGSGNTVLDNSKNYLTNLDMLPIIELRRDSVSITSNKTSERYKQTQKILGFIGIDVDTICDSIDANPDATNVTAAYVYFGAEIGSNNPLQAKMVYNTLEYLWYDPTIISNGQHQIRTSEGAYNSALSWEKQERIVGSRTGVVVGKYEGGVGTESVDGKNKYYGWVRKQETADEYVEYRIWNVSATVIILKEGLSDAVFKALSDTELLVMPISQYFIKKFSPIEQGQLFPEILRLATYAADIQHLKWYQTEAFMNLIQIVVVIITIVIFIFTWWTGGATAAAFYAAVEMLLIGMAVGYALKLLLQQIDNPYLRAIVAAIAVVAMAYYGSAKGIENMVLLTADTITTAVSEYSGAVLEGIAEQFATLSSEVALFAGLAANRQEELDKANEDMQSILSTEEVMKLSNMEVSSYIEGVDLKYYRAIQLQYEWDLIKTMKVPTKIYDYDSFYRLGVV